MNGDSPAPRARLGWTTVGVATVLTVCAVTALWVWIPPAYDTNDDVTIRGVLEGTRIPGQAPTGFALLPNAALGWFLVAVRDIWPSAYAWDTTVVGTLIFSMAIFLSLAWRRLGAGIMFPLSVVATAVAALLPLVSSVQYTISATMAGGAAVALAWFELHSEGPRRSVLTMAAALLALGLLVRPGGAMAGVLTAVACLLPRAIRLRAPGIRTMGTLVAASVALFVLLHVVDRGLYSLRPEWDAYRELNELVTALFDWNWQAALPSAVNVSGARRAVGWTAHDWLMLEHAWGVDPELFSVGPVRQFYDATAGQMGQWDYVAAAVRRSWTLDQANLSERLNETWPALLGMALVTGVYSRRRDLATSLAIVLFFAVYCLSVQAGFKSLPFRLLAPMVAAFILVVLSTMEIRPVGRKTAAVVLLAVLLLCGYQARTGFAAMAANHRHSVQVDAEGAALGALQPSLVVIHRDTFPEEHWQRPFHRPAGRLVTIRLGRNNQNPQLLSFLRDSGLSSFPSAICDRKSVIVISEPGRLDVLSSHLQEREGREVAWVPVYEGSFRAWQCVPAS